MSQAFYTSDVHAGHEFVARTRGFTSAKEHDEEIVRRWNKIVSPDDIVWVAGDAALGKRSETLEVFSDLNGRKQLIWGNHDSCFPGHANSWKFHALYLQYFETVQGYSEHRFGGRRVMVSHFPYHADHTGAPRYRAHRLRDEGQYLIHGHMHSKQKITSDHEIHVGLEAWDLCPVPQWKVLQLIAELEANRGSGADGSPQVQEPAILQ